MNPIFFFVSRTENPRQEGRVSMWVRYNALPETGVLETLTDEGVKKLEAMYLSPDDGAQPRRNHSVPEDYDVTCAYTIGVFIFDTLVKPRLYAGLHRDDILEASEVQGKPVHSREEEAQVFYGVITAPSEEGELDENFLFA